MASRQITHRANPKHFEVETTRKCEYGPRNREVNSGGSKLMNPVENNFDLHVSKYTIFKYSCL